MVILDADCFVYQTKLPWKIHGVITPNDDSTYSIFINNRLTDALQLAALVHEIRHIQACDPHSERSIEEVEHL